MHDYQANSNRSKETPKAEPGPDEIKLEKVVTGEVVSRKKPLGRKIKDAFVSVDAKSVLFYVVADVLIPAAKDMVVDAVKKELSVVSMAKTQFVVETMDRLRHVFPTTARLVETA